MGGGLFSKSEKRFSLGQVIGFGLALSLLLNTTPVQAVTDNLNSALVSVLGTVATNSGSIATNSSTIATNSSTIATNSDKLKGLDNLSSLNTNLANVNTSLASVVTKLDSINTKISNSSGGGGLSIRAVYNAAYIGNGNYEVLVSSVTNPSKCVVHNGGNFEYMTNGNTHNSTVYYDSGHWHSSYPFQIIEFY